MRTVPFLRTVRLIRVKKSGSEREIYASKGSVNLEAGFLSSAHGKAKSFFRSTALRSFLAPLPHAKPIIRQEKNQKNASKA